MCPVGLPRTRSTEGTPYAFTTFGTDPDEAFTADHDEIRAKAFEKLLDERLNETAFLPKKIPWRRTEGLLLEAIQHVADDPKLRMGGGKTVAVSKRLTSDRSDDADIVALQGRSRRQVARG